MSRKVIADAERGKPSTSAAVYVAMLWALGLDGGLAALADPKADSVGKVLSPALDRTRAGKSGRNPDFY